MTRLRSLAALAFLAALAPAATAQLPRDTALEQAVRTWYLQYFNREPEPDGLRGWTQNLRDGMSVEEAQAHLLGSDEYYGLHGARPRRFVRGLYQDVLGYDPRPEEAEYWFERLGQFGADGVNQRTALAAEFLQYVRTLTQQPQGWADPGAQPPPPPPQAPALEGFGCRVRQEPAGLRVYGVADNTFASRLGLHEGDLISACDGRPVRSPDQFRELLATPAVHQLGMVRGDLPCSASVSFADRRFAVKQAVQTVARVTESATFLPGLGCAVRPADAGLRVRTVEADSLASRLGLRPGDLVLGVNEQPVTSIDDFRRHFTGGDVRRLNLERAGRPCVAEFGRPGPGGLPAVQQPVQVIRRETRVVEVPGLGCRVIPEDGGLRVRGLVPNSPAAELGLHDGDLIRGVDGHPVRTVDQLRALTAQRQRDRVSMEVWRGKEAFRGHFHADKDFKVHGKLKKYADDD